MIVGYEAVFFIELCLLVYCVLDVIRTPEGACRNLPKLGWLLLVIVLPLAGGIAWLAVGRPLATGNAGVPYTGSRGIPAEYDRPGRAAAANPDDDAAFLAQLKARAEEQRAKAKREQDPEGPQP